MKRSFDALAKPYRFLERIAFGSTLQRARCHFLSHTDSCRNALLIGDGDGRFSHALLSRNSDIRVHSLDISLAMLETAKKRNQTFSNRFVPFHASALEHSYPENEYDCIALHFVLDCFEQDAVDSLLANLSRAAKENAVILYSDFQSIHPWQRIIVRSLYSAFKLTTGLQTKRLPNIKLPSPFEGRESQDFAARLITSQLWRKKTNS